MACGAPDLVGEALKSLKGQGSIVLIAMYAAPVPFDLQLFKSREFRMVGSITYTEEDFREAIELAERYQDDLAHIVTHRLPLEKAPEAFAMLANHTENAVRVVFDLAEK